MFCSGNSRRRRLEADPAAHEQQWNQVGLLAVEIAEEVEVGPVGRLQDTLEEERAVAALVGRLGRLKGRSPPRELVGADVDVEAVLLDVEHDRIARPHEPDGTPDCRLGRDVDDERAERRAADAGVGDADDVLDPLPQQLGRNRHRAELGEPGSADRAAVAQDHHAVPGDVEVGVVHTSREVVDVLEHERRPAVPEQVRRCGAALDDGALSGRANHAGRRARCEAAAASSAGGSRRDSSTGSRPRSARSSGR